MTVVAALSNFAVVQKMIVSGDAVATAENLIASAGTARLGAVGLLVVAVLDVIVAWGLYEVLKIVNPGLSLLGGWLRLVYAAIFAVAINSLLGAIRTAPTDATTTLLLVDQFSSAWMVGQVFFGLHLGVVGALAWRSRYIHWIFGLLLVIAGVGYLVDGIGSLVSPSYSFQLSMFTFIGEVVFIFWLLIRGPKIRLS
jgi:hypothetical protein